MGWWQYLGKRSIVSLQYPDFEAPGSGRHIIRCLGIISLVHPTVKIKTAVSVRILEGFQQTMRLIYRKPILHIKHRMRKLMGKQVDLHVIFIGPSRKRN
jgi:hypothetical protein